MTRSAVRPATLSAMTDLTVATIYDCIPLVRDEEEYASIRQIWSWRADLVRGADLVLAISRFSAEDAIAQLGLDPGRVVVVGTGVSEPLKNRPRRTTCPPASGEQFILYAGGTDDARKNLPRLVIAFSLLSPSVRASHRLVVVGRVDEHTENHLRGLARSAGVGDQLDFPGFVSDATLADLYERCACFVYPSLHEGFGLPIAEAMSYGAAVVASQTTACAELVSDPRAGFNPEDPADIARAVEDVVTDAAFAGHLSSLGRVTAAGLTWDRVCDRTIEAYAGALESAPSRTRRTRSSGLTFLSFSIPRPLSQSAAFLQTAGALGELGPVDYVSPVPLKRRRQTGFRPLASVAFAKFEPQLSGPLVVLIDSPESAAEAAPWLEELGGIAAMWTPWFPFEPQARTDIRRCMDAADLVWVSHSDDLHILTGDPTTLESTAHIAEAPPIAWYAASVGHQPEFETRMFLEGDRTPVRQTRSTSIVLVARPPEYGPFPPIAISRLSSIAARMCDLDTRYRLVLLGDVDNEVWDQEASVASGSASMTISPWPNFAELVAWSTAAEAILSIDGPTDGARRAAERLSLLADLPLVTTSPAPLYAWSGVHRVMPGGDSAQLADAVDSILRRDDDPTDRATTLAGFAPEAVAQRVDASLRSLRGADVAGANQLRPGRPTQRLDSPA